MRIDYWNMKDKIPAVIVYCCENDRCFNEDDGSLIFFETDDEFEQWKFCEYEDQQYTGFHIYKVFRCK